MIRYISTRGGGAPKSFEDVLLGGMAGDGGLYVPESWPTLDLESLGGKTYAEVAGAVMAPFVEGSIAREDLERMIATAYGPDVFNHETVVPLKELYPSRGLYVMELFHGPTLAFKDIALQLLGRLFDHVLTKRGESITIVGATSGDTGSAAIEGCRHSARANIFILFPEGRVSDVQRRQMTTVQAENVHNIAVKGTFDDCQAIVKAFFADESFRREMNLSAVNSINWARIMAQIVYYVHAALRLGAPEKTATFVVPTGNFGNVLAGYYARKMGVPLKLAIATNKNDILTRFFETGEMKAETAQPTLSPSMDIQVSSNFERYLFELLGRDAKTLSTMMKEFKESGVFAVGHDLLNNAEKDFHAFRTDEKETLETIKRIQAETGYVLDPHTAVAMCGALDMAENTEHPVVVLATAHPAKFPEAIERATGLRPGLPAHLAGLMEREEIFVTLAGDTKKIGDYIRQNFSQTKKAL
jgi:threonine synthase